MNQIFYLKLKKNEMKIKKNLVHKNERYYDFKNPTKIPLQKKEELKYSRVVFL